MVSKNVLITIFSVIAVQFKNADMLTSMTKVSHDCYLAKLDV